MNSKLLETCAIFFLAFSPVAVKSQLPAPDVILLNGKIFPSDAAHPYVEALAIRGERITATGDSAKIRTLAGPHTKEIDLGGRTVIPGINDAHTALTRATKPFSIKGVSRNGRAVSVSAPCLSLFAVTHRGSITSDSEGTCLGGLASPPSNAPIRAFLAAAILRHRVPRWLRNTLDTFRVTDHALATA